MLSSLDNVLVSIIVVLTTTLQNHTKLKISPDSLSCSNTNLRFKSCEEVRKQQFLPRGLTDDAAGAVCEGSKPPGVADEMMEWRASRRGLPELALIPPRPGSPDSPGSAKER